MSSSQNSQLKVEQLDARDLPSTAGVQDLVGIVRGGHDWYLAGNQTSNLAAQVRGFGLPGDQYLAGDWNGDGKTDLVAVHPNSSGRLDWLVDLNGDQITDTVLTYGLAGDTPVLGDFDGNRTSDPGVVRNNAIRGGLDWYLNTAKTPNANPTPRQYGLLGDKPIVGDWDGNGKTDLGITRPNGSSGLLEWYLDTNGDMFADITRSYGLLSTKDTPVVGDWNADGKTDLGVTRNDAVANTKRWYLDTNGDMFADIGQNFGFPKDIPIVGTWTKLPSPEITVVGTTSGQTAPINFGSATQGAVGPTRTFTVRNDGDGRLQLGAILPPSGFEIFKKLPTYLDPGKSDTFTVRLNTVNPGTFNGSILIANNDADEKSYSIPVSGTVIAPPAPKIIVSGVTDGQQAPIDFGTAVAGSTASSKTFTVYNDGNAPLTLGSINVPTGFMVVQNLPTSLGAKASATFSIALKTDSPGTFGGTVSFATNDPKANPFDFVVSGVVAPAVAKLSIVVNNKTLTGTSGTINFGEMFTHVMTPISMTISNPGNTDLLLNWSSIPSGFLFSSTPSRIAAGTSVDVSISLSPNVDSIFSYHRGSVSIGTNDPTASRIDLNLQGKLLAPPATVGGYPQGSSTFTIYGGGTWEIVHPTGSVAFATGYILRNGQTTYNLSSSVASIEFRGSSGTVYNWTKLNVINANTTQFGLLPFGLV